MGVCLAPSPVPIFHNRNFPQAPVVFAGEQVLDIAAIYNAIGLPVYYRKPCMVPFHIHVIPVGTYKALLFTVDLRRGK